VVDVRGGDSMLGNWLFQSRSTAATVGLRAFGSGPHGQECAGA
jgi:hypothetical protein